MTAPAGSRAGRVRTAALAHVETWRPYTVWYVGLLGLAGAGLAGEHRPWWLAVAWATPTLGWLAAHYLGDYLDRNLDAIGKAHRPIPSGRLAARTALTCGVVGMIAVGALAAAAGWATGLIAAGAVAGVLAYSGWLKANGLAGNLVRGLLGALTLLYGAAIVPAFDWRVLVFALAFCLHDTASNVVGTLRDVVGDRAGGYRTLPVERGTAAGVWTAVALYGLAVAAAAVGGRLQPAYLAVLAVVAAVGVLAFAPLVRLRAALPARVALRAHEVLVLERLGLAAAVVGLGVGPVPAVALLVPMVALTWWTQRRMRTWYELGPLDGPERTARDEA